MNQVYSILAKGLIMIEIDIFEACNYLDQGEIIYEKQYCDYPCFNMMGGCVYYYIEPDDPCYYEIFSRDEFFNEFKDSSFYIKEIK